MKKLLSLLFMLCICAAVHAKEVSTACACLTFLYQLKWMRLN